MACEEIEKLRAQRDELLTALKRLVKKAASVWCLGFDEDQRRAVHEVNVAIGLADNAILGAEVEKDGE